MHQYIQHTSDNILCGVNHKNRFLKKPPQYNLDKKAQHSKDMKSKFCWVWIFNLLQKMTIFSAFLDEICYFRPTLYVQLFVNPFL